MKQKKTWVVVANGDKARLFDLPARNTPLVPLDDHVWKAPEIHEYADTQGMSHSSVGSSQRRMAPRTEPDDQALDAFARDISEKLSAARKREEFERLALAAAPRLMGYLREHLDSDVKATIWMEIDRDFTHLPLDELRKVLEPHLNS
mgnify:CR=1 FL=1